MSKQLKIKVCGIKSHENMKAVSELQTDLLGFIFYPFSKRYVGDLAENKKSLLFNTKKDKTGVFVNEEIEILKIQSKEYKLDFIQLHGEETPDYCKMVRDSGFKIIKAFRIDNDFEFNNISDYEGIADYFLFDTKAKLYGGTGEKFNWEIIDNYRGETPFFLSGGINPGDINAIKNISHPKFYGIDLNSGFEDKPGLKNISKLSKFITLLKT